MDLIQYHLDADENMQQKLIPFYHTSEGKKWFDHFYEVNVGHYAKANSSAEFSLIIWKNCTA